MLTIEQLRASGRPTITVKDASEILGVTPRTLTGALSIHGGRIRAVRVGRRVVIPSAPFLAYLEGEAVGSPAPERSEPEHDSTAIIRAKLIELLGTLEGVS